MRNLINILYINILKPIFFKFDPEYVHDRFTASGAFFGRFAFTRALFRKLFRYDHPVLETTVAGLRFKNPIMLSAGFDKQADMINLLPSIGFGGMELGSLTWKPYKGNEGKRLHRLPKSKAIVVYYGLKNLGVVATIEKIKRTLTPDVKKLQFVLGVSIAKTNSPDTCELNAGVEDYYQGYKAMVDGSVGDFYTINISCPNAFGGEPFTTPERLEALFTKLDTVKSDKPVFVKMPINTEWAEFKKLLEVLVKHKVAGVVIGNLNKNHQDLNIVDPIPAEIKGGISGKPTFELSNNLIRQTYLEYGRKLVIIGTGGIFSAEDAYTKIKLGSSAVQLITGMIFNGPQFIGQVNEGLAKLLLADGYKSVAEAVGVDAK